MAAFLETALTGPNFIATVLLALVVMYWLMMILTGIGADGLDVDLDMDADVDVDAALSIGGVIIRWLNIGQVPLMIWGSVFALSFWVISVSIPLPDKEMQWWYVGLLALRDGALALIPTKVLTQPLRGKFDPAEPNRPQDLLGREGLALMEISPGSGQAQFPAEEGAPLVLNVRTLQGLVEKGTIVRIVDYDAEHNIHVVQRADPKQGKEV